MISRTAKPGQSAGRPRLLRAPEGAGSLGASEGTGVSQAAPGEPPNGFLKSLHVNRHSKLSIQAQLHAQIEYAIATGLLRERAPLPSINEVAAALRINRNTVLHVYRRLSEGGLLDVEHGRGVFVSSASAAPVVRGGLSELIEQTFLSAASLGVSPVTFGGYLQSQAPAFESRFPLVTFIECNRHQATEFAHQIGQRWQMEVVPLLLSVLQESPGALPPSCRLVVTTYFHYAEVRRLLRSQRVVTRAVVLDVMSGLHERLQQLPKHARVGIVHLFEGVHEVEEEFAEAARTRELDLRTYPFHHGNEEGLKEFLETVDIVVCTDTVRDAVRRSKARGRREVLEWKAALHPAELDAVRKSVPFLHAL